MSILKIHPGDDMGVALADLKLGMKVDIDGQTLRLRTAVPAKHKVYLRDLPANAFPKLYGMPAGKTTRPVQRGEAATVENLASLRDTMLTDLPPLTQWTPPDLGDLPTTFAGYRRPDGGVGTRNHILVAYTVPCVAHIAERIVAVGRRAFGLETEDPWVAYARTGEFPPSREAPEQEGIDDIVMVQHTTGCAMPDHGDRERLLRFLAGYVRHPNVAGAIVLGLGCEKAPLQELRSIVGETWKPVVYLEHQQLGTEEALMRSALDALRDMVQEAQRHRREPVPIAALMLGTECGGSDGFSGITANPTVGVVSDLIVAQEGTVILPEVPEMFGAETILMARAAASEVRERIAQLIQGFASYAERFGAHVEENLSFGNVREGLTTIQIKSLGVIQKAGSSPIVGVLEYGEPASRPGVHLLNAPGFDIPSVSALPLSGANVVIFTTGLGTPTGNPIVPVIKVASNHETARRMHDVIDFDTGDVMDGESLDAVGRRLYRFLVEVASGCHAANERLGHRESAFWNLQLML